MRRVFTLFTACALLASPVSAAEESSFLQTFQNEMAALKAKYGNFKLTTGQTGVITGSIYCVVRKAGLTHTVAFYRDVKTVAEKAKPMCEKHLEGMAKDYVLAEYTKRKDDPLVKATLECYQEHAADIAGIIPDARKRGQLSSYYRWAQDPAAAQREMTGHEICH